VFERLDDAVGCDNLGILRALGGRARVGRRALRLAARPLAL
jgi:hypothetical protein